MNTVRLSLLALLLSSAIYADNMNAFFDKEHHKKFTQEELNKTRKYYHQAKIFKDKRDLKSAENEFDKILQIVPHNLYSDDYIFALLTKAKLYAYFEDLDKAKESILLACGIPEKLAKEISQEKDICNQKVAKKFINKIENLIDKENFYGYHAVRSYLFSVAKIKNVGYEKQRDKARDSMGKYSLYLYPQLLRLESMKINRRQKLEALQNELKTAKNPQEIKKLETILAYTYSSLGEFDKALEISNRHLSKNPKDLDALYNKMNIFMTKGEYQKMKEYEKKILEIKPNAF